MKILDRYITTSVITGALLVLMALFCIETFVSLTGQLSDIGQGHYTVGAAFQYVLLMSPFILYELFPIAALLGSLVGLGGLASTHQLIAMRAAGYSMGKIIFSVIKAALILLVLMMLVGETLAPQWANKAIEIKNKALNQSSVAENNQGSWFKDQNKFVHVELVKSDTDLQNIIQYDFEADGELRSIQSSKTGELGNGVWHLQNSLMTHFTKNRVITNSVVNLPFEIQIERRLILFDKNILNFESMVDLYRSYHYRYHAGLSYTQLELSFWQRLFQPLTVIVMIFLGVPLAFGSLRTWDMSSRLLVGGLLGFGFYIINQFVSRLSIAIQMPPILAALLPTLLFALLSLFLFQRSK